MTDSDPAVPRALPGRRLVLVVACVAVVAGGLGVVFATRNYQVYRDEVTANLVSRAERAASRVDAFVVSRQRMLAGVARTLEGTATPVEVRALARVAGEARPDAVIVLGAVERAVTAGGRRSSTGAERRLARDVLATRRPGAVLAPGDPAGMLIGVPVQSGGRAVAVVTQRPSPLDAAVLLAPDEVRLVEGALEARASRDGWRVLPVNRARSEALITASAGLQGAPWRVDAWRPQSEALGSARREAIWRVTSWLLLAIGAVGAALVVGRRVDRAIRAERRERRRLETVAMAARRVALAMSPAQVAEAVLADPSLCRTAATVVVRDGRAEVLAWRGTADPTWAVSAPVISAIGQQLLAARVMEDVDVPGLPGPVTVIPFRLDGPGAGAMLLRERPRPRERMLDEVTAEALATQASEGLQRAFAQEREQDERRRAEVLARINRVLHEGLTVNDRAAAALRVIVPEVADFALIEEVLEGGDTRVLASLHREPELLPAVEHEHGPAAVDAACAAARRLVMVDRRPRLLSTPGRDAMLAAPVTGRGGLGAVLLLGTTGAGGRQLTDADIPLAQALGDAVGVGLDNARLFQEQRAIALRLQLSLLPGRLDSPEGIDLAVRFEAGAAGMEVGGDWYDVIPLDGGCTGIVVGDVVGRGIDAATVMGRLRFGFKALARRVAHPGAALDELDAFAADIAGSDLTTVAYAIVDGRRGILRYSCAGHPPPILVRADGSHQVLEGARSAPLGAGASLPRNAGSVSLARGDILVLYTDGLVERRGSTIDEGINGLARAVALHAREEPHAIAEIVLREWCIDLDDDLVLLCVRVSHVGAVGTPHAGHEEDADARRHDRRSRAGDLPGV